MNLPFVKLTTQDNREILLAIKHIIDAEQLEAEGILLTKVCTQIRGQRINYVVRETPEEIMDQIRWIRTTKNDMAV